MNTKAIYTIIGVLFVGFFTLYLTQPGNQDTIESDISITSNAGTQIGNSQQSQPIQQAKQIEQLPSNVKVIEITAKQWEFIPNIIELKVGEPVILRVTSIDVTHGIAVPDLGINEMLEPNKAVDIPITPTKVGDYRFSCSVYCGIDHGKMTGVIKVIS